MSTTAPTATAARTRLRSVLRQDALACAGFGLLMTAGFALVDSLLGLGPAWAVPFGVYLLGCAAVLALVAGHPDLVRGQVVAVVVNNALAAIALAVLPFTGLVDLTVAGYIVLLGGAALVALFTVLEAAGVKHL
ncbi:hypothetical protein [Glycomyces terrestris]|uniref:Uncharacterized protein n=1 Tax=Glycomyces terrestris TaxID=2493553 RepID=A0A426UYY1_9ACTN|nr:hypothetical protein [Glycomyces terrestris]RRR99781.1 hypothetical protein EIW28_13985 [Glycomyces terrestris]